MELENSINKFYYEMAINELHQINNGDIYPHISYNSLLYINIISFKENCTVSFIANALNISKSAVTLKINELVKLGFVSKTQCDNDKRVNHLTLCGEMEAEYDDYKKQISEATSIINKHYPKKDIRKFCEMLNMFSKCHMEGTGK